MSESSALSPGAMALVLLAALVLTIPVALGMLWQYNRAVLAGMRRHGAVDDAAETAESSDHEPERPTGALALEVIGPGAYPALPTAELPIFRRATHGARAAALVYAVAGLGYALYATTVMLVSAEIEASPVRLLVIVWAQAWPIVITVNLVTVANWRGRVRNSLIYAALGGLVALFVQTDRSAVPIYWALVVGVPYAFLYPLLHPRLRAVGPLVFVLMVIGVIGVMVAMNLAATNSGMYLLARVALAMGFGDGVLADIARTSGLVLLELILTNEILALLGGVMLVGFALFGVLGWLALNIIGRLYQAKWISDQSIIVDLVWLVFTLSDVLQRSFEGPVWGLAALGGFVVYKTLATVGFGLVARLGGPLRNHRLLLLRVFGSRSRSEGLMALVGAHWRYIGSIQLIAATDLASSTVEPHEFLDFARGKLADRYVKSRAGLERQLADMDLRPDGDGRFRVNEFFCHDDTWKMTLSRLAAFDDAVLMDLRDFSPANQGCIFELQQLVNLVPLDKVVLVVDRTTDIQFLQQVLEDAWAVMPPTSPNRRLRPARVTAVHLTGADRVGASVVLAGLVKAIADDPGHRAVGHPAARPLGPVPA